MPLNIICFFSPQGSLYHLRRPSQMDVAACSGFRDRFAPRFLERGTGGPGGHRALFSAELAACSPGERQSRVHRSRGSQGEAVGGRRIVPGPTPIRMARRLNVRRRRDVAHARYGIIKNERYLLFSNPARGDDRDFGTPLIRKRNENSQAQAIDQRT